MSAVNRKKVREFAAQEVGGGPVAIEVWISTGGVDPMGQYLPIDQTEYFYLKGTDGLTALDQDPTDPRIFKHNNSGRLFRTI